MAARALRLVALCLIAQNLAEAQEISEGDEQRDQVEEESSTEGGEPASDSSIEESPGEGAVVESPSEESAEPEVGTAPVLEDAPAAPVLEEPVAPVLEEVTLVESVDAQPGEVEAIEELDLEALLSQDVVTASGQVEGRAIAPANVYEIRREEIDANGWRSVGEALRYVPGLYVIDDLVTTSVAVRGITGGLRAGSRIVKVMINGVPVAFRPNLAALLGPEFIPIDVVQRIEVAKGPLSALYGANAFLATVNVITRTPESGVEGTVRGRLLGLQGRVTEPDHPAHASSSEAQWFRSIGGGTYVGFGSAHWNFLAAASMGNYKRSGLVIDPTFEVQDPDRNRYQPLFADRTRLDSSRPLGIYIQAQGQDERIGTVTLQGGFQRLDSNGELQPGSVLTHQSRYSIANMWSDLRFEREIGEVGSIHAHVGASHGEPTRDERLFLTASNDYSFTRNFDYTAVDMGAGARLSPIEQLSLTVAVDGSLEDHTVLFYDQTFNRRAGTRMPGDTIEIITDDDRREVDLSNFGAQLGIAAMPLPDSDDLRLGADFRVDVPNLFDIQYSFRGFGVYRWNQAAISKLIVGRAFQVPSVELLYGVPGFGNEFNVIGARTINRELLPQTVFSAELVNNFSIAQMLGIELSLFYQSVENRISFSQETNNFVANNSGTQQSFGGELTLRLQSERAAGTASASLVFPIDDGVQTSGVPLFPVLTVYAGSTLHVPEAYLDLTAVLRAASSRGASQGNTLLNGGESYSLPAYGWMDLFIATKGVELFGEGIPTVFRVGVQNVLDTRVNEPGYGGFDIPALGRTLFFELRQELK